LPRKFENAFLRDRDCVGPEPIAHVKVFQIKFVHRSPLFLTPSW
jgi:hypothetical protein